VVLIRNPDEESDNSLSLGFSRCSSHPSPALHARLQLHGKGEVRAHLDDSISPKHLKESSLLCDVPSMFFMGFEYNSLLYNQVRDGSSPTNLDELIEEGFQRAPSINHDSIPDVPPPSAQLRIG